MVFKNIDKNDKNTTYVNIDKQLPSSDIYYPGDSSEKKTLESLAFDDALGLNFFKERLKFNTFIEPIVVNRITFDGYKGDFLVKKSAQNTYRQDEYTLYLPDSMKISELPALIKKVNRETYGEMLPESASTIEIKHKIEYTLQYLLSIKNETNKDEMQKAISKYYQLFEQYFPGEKPNVLNSHKNIENDYFTALEDVKNNDKLVESIEDILSESLYEHLFEAFFEMWSDMIWEVGKIKTTIWINILKQELQIAKKTGNKEVIAKKEKEIVNKMLFTLNAFYEKHKKDDFKTEFEMSQPSEIIKYNMANCVWLATIGHEVLTELGIDHDSRLMFGHIALSVKLTNGKEYFFDPKSENTLIDMKIAKKNNNSEELVLGNDTIFTIRWDNERMLLSSILFNKSKNLIGITNIKEKIFYMEQAVDMEWEKNSIFLYILADAYDIDKQYDKALVSIEKAIELTPDRWEYWYEKQNILWKLKIFDRRYTEAQKMIKKYE